MSGKNSVASNSTVPGTYRVWMRDGYASLHNACSEAEARQAAIELATKNIAGCAMTPREKRQAVAVDYVDCLSEPKGGAA